jgi:hypothetical protein
VWIWATAGALAYQPDPAMLRKMFEEALPRARRRPLATWASS